MNELKDNYSVYKITCNITGEAYIGVTKQKPEHRWRSGKGYTGRLRNDVDTFGWNNFTAEVLYSGISREEAAAKEIELIEYFNSICNGYNTHKGGDIPSDESVKKITQKLIGRSISPEVRQHMSEARKGIIFSEDHIKNLSKSHMGNPGYWEGKKRSRETTRKISEKLSIPIRCVETGVIYKNLKDASEQTGFPMSNISKWCNGTKPRNCTFTFEKVV